MFADAIASARKANEEKVKKKSLIVRIGQALWEFITSNRALFLFSEESFVRRFANAFIVWVLLKKTFTLDSLAFCTKKTIYN